MTKDWDYPRPRAAMPIPPPPPPQPEMPIRMGGSGPTVVAAIALWWVVTCFVFFIAFRFLS